MAISLSVIGQGSQGAAGPRCALVGVRLGVEAFAHCSYSTTNDQVAAVEQGRISRVREWAPQLVQSRQDGHDGHNRSYNIRRRDWTKGRDGEPRSEACVGEI